MTRELIAVDCPKCGVENQADPIHPGETYRATTCTGCGDWFAVYDGRD